MAAPAAPLTSSSSAGDGIEPVVGGGEVSDDAEDEEEEDPDYEEMWLVGFFQRFYPIFPALVQERFFLTREEAQEAAENTEQGKNFRTLLFTKIIPNLKRIGLLNDKVMPKYEQLGVLSYADLEDNFNIDWADMSKPYETQEEIEKFISAQHH